MKPPRERLHLPETAREKTAESVMPHVEQQPILIKPNNHPARLGILQITAYDKRDRLIRAAKILGIYWALALLSVPILVAHWVLVPGFFIAGPVMAYLRYRVTERSDKATGQCPVCNHDIAIRLEPAERSPMWKYCPVCNAPLQLLTPSP